MFTTDPLLDLILRSGLLSALALTWVVVCVRIVGLRAFSKMTSFDFVATVATGSLLAGAVQASEWSTFFQASLAIASLLGVQASVAVLRRKSDSVETAIQNSPMLLTKDGAFIEEALSRTRTSKSDIVGKLREANVLSLSEVRAVVLEATGDISVLHGKKLDDVLLDGVSDSA